MKHFSEYTTNYLVVMLEIRIIGALYHEWYHKCGPMWGRMLNIFLPTVVISINKLWIHILLNGNVLKLNGNVRTRNRIFAENVWNSSTEPKTYKVTRFSFWKFLQVFHPKILNLRKSCQILVIERTTLMKLS